MNRLEVTQVDISYGTNKVVHEASFNLEQGAIGCLLGPSGCGKTTLLLAIAGFQQPTAGAITIDSVVMSDDKTFTLPEKRQVGMVFQDFALFPNLSVAGNIRFGISHLSNEQQQSRVTDLLNMINMSEYAESYPHQLSGGQQQRVALARAMAPKPRLLLLDEPFSSLDVELREQLAREVRTILKQESVSAILVTHDQHEAFAMADNICVMSEGEIQQQDTAYNLYRQPANPFVAEFIGEGTLISGAFDANGKINTALGNLSSNITDTLTQNDKVSVLIRPDEIVLTPGATIEAVITERNFRGAQYLYTLQLADNSLIQCLATTENTHEVGSTVGITLCADNLVFFPEPDLT